MVFVLLLKFPRDMGDTVVVDGGGDGVAERRTRWKNNRRNSMKMEVAVHLRYPRPMQT